MRNCPSQITLEQVKDILQYTSDSWLHLFTSLGGVQLLLDALNQHMTSCRVQRQQQQQLDDGSSSMASLALSRTGVDRPASADALAAAQECLRALVERRDGEKQQQLLLRSYPAVLQLLSMCLTCQVS